MLSVFEKPNVLLRLEGGAVFALALAVYWQQSFSWPLFWSTILIPDLAMLGYLVNAQFGARAYNLTHSKLLPGLLGIFAISTGNALCMALALIWFVHIGIDRLLGYGLKYADGFKLTHLGIIGREEGEPRGRYLPCGK
ncbi:DUF4260 domain-containing protein [Sulfuriferula sp. GW1]|uniref:DUF4260 domain-containing protein n=1 Tax=Sulfuriferula sp. GW1 TaxID=3345111 RepID=UPI0039AE9E07